jgi:iron complex transport system substrate-binding protein
MKLIRLVAALALMMAGAAAAIADEFPVTLTHKFGTTTIDKQPERVVSLGFSGIDNLLALGVKPVAVRYWYGDYDYAAWPWAQDALGDAKPEVLKGDLNIEQIAALRPDVIIAISSGITPEQYDLLSQIAPVVASEEQYGDYGTPWQAHVQSMAKALGKTAEGDAAIKAIEDRFASIREAHPDWQGKSAAVGFYWNDAPGAYRSKDIRPRMLEALGFKTPASIDDAGTDPTAFFVSLSAEDLSPLDADVLIWFDDEGKVETLPLRPATRAFKEGREIFPDTILSGAFSYSSLLSINYALDHLVPLIEAAVDGDPATTVADKRAQ